MRLGRASGIALGLVVAIAGLTLTGCTAGPSNEQLASQLESIATKHISGLNGAFVSLSYEGSDRAILLVLYTRSDDPAVLATEVQEGFRAMWRDSPFRPSSVAVGAANRTRPAHPMTVEPDSADPRPIAKNLGIAQKYTSSTWIDIPENVLISRYGERKQTSGS